jgi:hypothetical protein
MTADGGLRKAPMSGQPSAMLVLGDVLADPAGYEPWANETAQWVRDVICGPPPAARRPGALCPYVPAAIRRGVLTLTPCPEATRRAAVSSLLDEGGWFQDRLRRADRRDRLWLSHLVVFTGLAGRGEMLGEIRQTLRPAFLRIGVTIGDFWPENPDASVYDTRHRVGQAPWPCVAMRHTHSMDASVYRISPDRDAELQHLGAAPPRHGSGIQG